MTTRRGLTLLELMVTIAILVAVAALMVPLLSTTASTASLDTTYQTMLSIRDAIMGTPTVAGYYQDMKGGLPAGVVRTIAATNAAADTNGVPDTLADLYTNPFTITVGSTTSSYTFDPQFRRGWRGPYLSQSAGAPLGQVLDSFPVHSGNQITASGSPIIIEWPTSATVGTTGAGGISATANFAQYVRLRSFGPDGQRFSALDKIWDPTYLANAAATNAGPTTWGDDLVLYIRRDVAGMDWTNYWDTKKRLANNR